MTTASTNGSWTPEARAHSSGSRKAREGTAAHVRTLAELVGGHPDAMRALYAAGRATDPVELGDAPRGLVLVLEPTRDFHFLVRPIVQAFAGGAMPWQGKRFEPGGTGVNVVWGRQVAPFGFETSPSEVDGEPALILRYDLHEHRNAWPLRNIRDELRTIGDGLAIGPALFSATASGPRRVLAWFGLERGGAP